MKRENNEIHIAFAFDENYITPFCVLLTSIFINNRESDVIVHSIATGVSNIEKEKISEYVKANNGEIYFYDIDKSFGIETLDSPYLSSTHYTITIFYRLFFPFLIAKKIKKLLYLDTDIVVLGSLKTLYDTNIGVFPIGAALDTAMGRNNDPLLLKIGVQKEYYFNSGVLLIDIDTWKKQNITEKSIRFITDNQTILKFPDQDALNHILKDNYYNLSNLNNFTWDDIPIDQPKKEILKKKITILHYTGIKPWKSLNSNRLRSYYHYYLKKSPCADSKKYTDFKWTKNHIIQFIKIRIIEFYLDNAWIRNTWKKIKL